MFTDKDLVSYFDQLQQIERKMYESYRYLNEQLTHPEYKKIFGQMAKEEKAHDDLIEELKKLFVR